MGSDKILWTLLVVVFDFSGNGNLIPQVGAGRQSPAGECLVGASKKSCEAGRANLRRLGRLARPGFSGANEMANPDRRESVRDHLIFDRLIGKRKAMMLSLVFVREILRRL